MKTVLPLTVAVVIGLMGSAQSWVLIARPVLQPAWVMVKWQLR
jgi:hypothetical protein